jgi:hypothetical protein
MSFWANDPGTLPRMLGADESARGDELNVYLHWPLVGDADGEGAQAKAPKARSLFLGQLPDDAWTDERPDSEGFEPDATFETELVEPVELPAGEIEQSRAPAIDEPFGDATAPVPPAAVPPNGGREAQRAARYKRAKVRRSLVVAVAVVGVVATFLGGTGVYVGTQAKAGDAGARRPTSTSFERQSTPTTATTVGAPDTAPITEPAPAPDPASGSAAPASSPGAPRGTSPRQTGSAGTGGGGPAATSQPAPGSTGAPPSSGSPPSAPPRTPTCQLLPVVCP